MVGMTYEKILTIWLFRSGLNRSIEEMRKGEFHEPLSASIGPP